jgi:CheY-like chemotaxis protein
LKALRRPPRLILLDPRLPKVNGLEGLRRLREHLRTRFVPEVVLTSSKGESDIVQSSRRGTRVELAVNFGLRMSAVTLALLLAVGVVGVAGAERAARAETALERNGFVLEPSGIPVEEILAGGPPRDGIPALDEPAHLAAESAPWRDDEIVVGVTIGEQSRAYPLAVLVWHELVNDQLGGLPLLVSYCPLCGSAMVFDRRVAGAARRFGVSGLLYRSDLLMYDRESESLWSQIAARAVAGPALETRLTLLRSSMMQWGRWKRLHPRTTVLSPRTGYSRPYGRSPYGDYAESSQLRFPAPVDRRYHPKTRTLGLRSSDGTARAYPSVELLRAGGSVEERFASHPVSIRFDPKSGEFETQAPEDLEVIESYWFAWSAFHPDTSVFVAPVTEGAAGEAP